MKAKQEALVEVLLTEMFRRVGKQYSPLATREPEWYTKTTWSRDDEAEFKKWAVQRLKRSNVLRPEREVDMFLISYGWSYDSPR